MKQAAIIKTKNKFIIYPISKTVNGVGIASEPFLHIPLNDSYENLVKNIFIALSQNKLNLNHPKQSEWKNVEYKYLNGLEMKSIKEIHKQSSYCLVELSDDMLQFTPTINYVSKKTFHFMQEKKMSISINEDPGSIIKILKKTFDNCE